ncbi:MAG: tetratricopeptide repeat protein [Bryobacteraceae bacterium]
MFARLLRVLSSITIVSVLSTGLLPAQEQKKKDVKDEGERQVFTEVTKATDPARRLQFLDAWKQKYPESDYKEERLLYYLNTYQQLNQGAKLYETAKELLALDPANVQALYWLTLLTETMPPTPESLATGEKAAQGLLQAKKPANVTDANWEAAKKTTDVAAYKTLAFVASARKDLPGAEKQYAKVLEMNPNFAEVSYKLGMVIFQQKNPDRNSEILFHWARAASLTGVGQLQPDAEKKRIDGVFVKAYVGIHGSEDGVKEVRTAALASPMPPAGFKVKSKHEIEAENQEKFAKENPQLALWMSVKKELLEKGDAYFESSFKGTAPPKFRAWVVSTKPAVRPKEILVAIEKKDGPAEATLKLENPMAGKADPGAEIEFEGVPSAFTKEPFMVTFDVESKDKISGWPAPPPMTKKAPAGKKAGTKKKG